MVLFSLVNKSIWVIVVLAAGTALVMAFMMMITLGQFQEIPAADWVKLAEATTAEFKLEKVAVRVSFAENPTAMHLSYVTKKDSKFDAAVQNAEMERVAEFAVNKYTGSDLYRIERVRVTRSEVTGSGCFQQTYVATLSYANTRRTPPARRLGGTMTFPPRSP